jgi:hypothetical protein
MCPLANAPPHRRPIARPCRTPDDHISRVGPLGVLWREAGKIPSFFNAEQIQALVDQHQTELEAGNPPGHREADEDDF